MSSMTSFRPFIPVFADPRAFTSSGDIISRLRESFTSCSVAAVDTNNFFASLNAKSTIMAVLPGIVGETSYYHQLIGDAGMAKIKDFVERGGILLTACAGSYYITEQTKYAPPWGPEKSRSNPRALFNGLALGPIPGSAFVPNKTTQFEDITLVPVLYEGADGNWLTTEIAYGNGPALYNYPEDKNTTILAHYETVLGRPPAIVWKKMGAGAILWLGALPYIGPQVLGPNATTLQKTMVARLTTHEDGRKDLWNNITARINAHLKI